MAILFDKLIGTRDETLQFRIGLQRRTTGETFFREVFVARRFARFAGGFGFDGRGGGRSCLEVLDGGFQHAKLLLRPQLSRRGLREEPNHDSGENRRRLSRPV